METSRVLTEGWRLWLLHRTNPLHVYCRLMDLGLGRSVSRRVCRFYERHVFPAGRREWKRN